MTNRRGTKVGDIVDIQWETIKPLSRVMVQHIPVADGDSWTVVDVDGATHRINRFCLMTTVVKAEGGQPAVALKPSDFVRFPCKSTFGKTEYEIVAQNIMRILSEQGNIWKPLSWEQYAAEQAAFEEARGSSSIRNDKSYFDEVAPFSLSADAAATFSPAWKAEGGQ